MNRLLFISRALGVMMFILPGIALAQSKDIEVPPCDQQHVASAEEKYNKEQAFTEVIEMLEERGCTKPAFDDDLRAASYRLLALSNYYLGNKLLFLTLVRELVALKEGYADTEIKDPPFYVECVKALNEQFLQRRRKKRTLGIALSTTTATAGLAALVVLILSEPSTPEEPLDPLPDPPTDPTSSN